jgi:carbon monoxide dehydrogenase subunit G
MLGAAVVDPARYAEILSDELANRQTEDRPGHTRITVPPATAVLRPARLAETVGLRDILQPFMRQHKAQFVSAPRVPSSLPSRGAPAGTQDFSMQVQNRFEVPMPPAEAWVLLMDIPSTVAAFPGAELVETIDENNYKGRVTVKLGPMTLVFLGKLRIENRDKATRSATVKATWTEIRGRGNAVTLTRFAMREHDHGTVVEVDSDIQLAGQVAQYGRGAGMISEVSAQVISKFAENLRASINAVSPKADEARTKQHAPPRHKELSVLGLLWSAVLNRFKRLFN